MKNMTKYAPWLLLIGGIVNLVPKLYHWLTNLTNGYPWIQIVVGGLSVIVALLSFKK